MSKENVTVEEKSKKKLPIKGACLVLVGIIAGLVISWGLFACAIEDAANKSDFETVTSGNNKEEVTTTVEEVTTTVEEVTTTVEEVTTVEEETTVEEKVEETAGDESETE